MGETKVPSHSIVCIRPEADDLPIWRRVEQGINLILTNYCVNAIGDNEQNLGTVDAILGGEGQHDVIVAIASQLGGLTGNATTTIQRRVQHLDEIKSEEVHRRVIELLRQSPKSDSFAPAFPAPKLENKSNLNFQQDRNRCQETSQTDSFFDDAVSSFSKFEFIKQVHAEDKKEFVSDVKITFEPPPDTIVNPKQKIQIRFDIQGGSPQDCVLFSIDRQFYSNPSCHLWKSSIISGERILCRNIIIFYNILFI